MFDPSWNADSGQYRRRRRPGRFLAPIALVVVIAGTYLIVEQGVNSSHTASTQVKRTQAPRLTRAQRRFAHDRFYTVKPGESLSSIADRTGVSVHRLEALNPRINPDSLLVGQRIRLRR
jgi:LysM repeat protein